jgi:outer membrane lipoprotein-sorting protein
VRLTGRVTLGAALLLPALAAGAPRCASTAACLQALEQAQRHTHSLSARFVQVKHVSLLDEPLVSSGRFFFKSPDRMLLRIEHPQPATVVIRGQDVEIPGLPEEARRALSAAPVAAMFTQLGAAFTGAGHALQSTFAVSAHAEGGEIHLHLQPRTDRWKEVFRSIDVRFAGPELLVQSIRLDDDLGDSLEITLRDVKRNVDVPDALFAPHAP